MPPDENEMRPAAEATRARVSTQLSGNALDESRSWFKAMRNADALELARRAPNAFRLAYFIAYRARWNDGFNADNLRPGEALIGDHESYGMSPQEYRTAKGQLSKWNFATFRATNKGTIARLIDTRLFYISDAASNEPANIQTTDDQQTANEQATTNYKGVENKERIDAKDGAGGSGGIVELSDEDYDLLAAYAERKEAEQQAQSDELLQHAECRKVSVTAYPK